MKNPIRLLIIANPPVLNELFLIFQLADGIEVVGKAASSEEAGQLAQASQPDIFLVDLEMSNAEGNGYLVITRLKEVQAAKGIVALTAHDYPAARNYARECGADAILIKGAELSSMIEDLQSLSSLMGI